MVVSVANANIKRHSAIQFLQILFHMCTMLQNKIHNVQITITSAGIGTIIKPQKSHCRSKVYAPAISLSVKSARKQCVIFAICGYQSCFRSINACLDCKLVCKMFPNAQVITIISRWEFCDTQISFFIYHTCLGARTAKRRPRLDRKSVV